MYHEFCVSSSSSPFLQIHWPLLLPHKLMQKRIQENFRTFFVVVPIRRLQESDVSCKRIGTTTSSSYKKRTFHLISIQDMRRWDLSWRDTRWSIFSTLISPSPVTDERESVAERTKEQLERRKGQEKMAKGNFREWIVIIIIKNHFHVDHHDHFEHQDGDHEKWGVKEKGGSYSPLFSDFLSCLYFRWKEKSRRE